VRSGRISGVDAARAVALVGMAAVHVMPLRGPYGTGTLVGEVAYGRASALFAVLAGVGVALGSGGTRLPDTARAHAEAAVGLLVRGLLVGLLGLALVALDPPVAVILAYYGLLFVVATPLLGLRAGALAAGAVLCCAATPVLSHLLRAGGPDNPGPQPGLDALAAPGDLLTTLALTGYYPVLTWTTYLLAGMAVGRLDLHRTRTAAALLAGGAALAVAASAVSALLLGPHGGAAMLGREVDDRHHGSVPTDTWWWLAVEAPHAGTPADLAHTVGSALAVLGAALLLARLSPPLVWPLAAAGSIPLTLYTLHVVAVTIEPGRGPYALTVLGWNVAGALAVGMTLRLAGWRGPLETAVSAAGRLARGVVHDTARARP
jgi:hypothetical protein